MNSLQFKKWNEEVLFAEEAIVSVGRSEVDLFKKNSEQNQRKRIRLCTHRNTEDKLHEMLIVHTKGTYVRPHKHLNKSESFHIIEGLVDVVILDEQGKIMEVISMGDYSSGRKFYYRISEPYYHTLLIASDILVFHETTSGPFARSDTIFALWSPEEKDENAVQKFMNHLEKNVRKFASIRTC